ncbi:hypothetical protein [Paenirhodobacter populi]|uniref:Uncharacterized protein n=1 Tax=Paenirhodobacter populi TaxID=2306993 RepID=A0A443J064_9RHOB|nr:hypothetical protein [Sinirhodobacter populi]RWR13817.1 hypothetical protein D2T33_05310 [Sinirhodobacter populi]
MSIILAEGWQTFADKSEIQFGWPLHASINTTANFAGVSGRRTLDLYGSKVAKAFTPARKVCAHFIVDLTAGTVGSTTLFQFGLNPPNIQSTGYTSTSSDRFRVVAFGSNLQVVRSPFSPDGTVQSGTQTVAQVAHGMSAGASYRVEVMVDVTSETGVCEVLINGVSVLNSEFSRAYAGFACDAPFGIVSLFAQSTSGVRGRLSNVILYDVDADTPWPVGPLNITYMPAAGRPGETFTFPPALTDSEVPVTTTTGETWGFSPPPVTTSIKAIIGHLRLAAPDAVVPASADVSYLHDGGSLVIETHQVQPGTPVLDRFVRIPNSAATSLADIKLNVRLTP